MGSGQKTIFFTRCCAGAGKKELLLPAAHSSGQKESFSCPPLYKRSLSARIIGQKNVKNVLV